MCAADALLEAWLWASARFWERRAAELEAARPRRNDFTGLATAADLTAAYDRLTAAAAACRTRAAGADGWAPQALRDAGHDLEAGAAA